MSKPASPSDGDSQSDIFAPSADMTNPAPSPDAAPPSAEIGQSGGVATSAPEPPPASFESALTELEAVVARMESGELTLEQSLSAYKRGATLLQYCQSKLNDAQQQVKILEAGVLKDFFGAGENGQ